MTDVATQPVAAPPLGRPLRAGDRVCLRSPAEILATLDENGRLDGLPFMPEMLRWFGRIYTVKAQVARACDTISGPGVDGPSIRRFPGTVVLNGLRCGGAEHGGCQAQCLLYWKEAWLRSADGPSPVGDRDDPAFARLEELALAHVYASETTAEEPVYSCQATEMLRASELVPRWSVGSFLHEIRSGNVSVWRFLRVTTGIVLCVVGRRLRLVRTSLAPFRPEELSDDPLPTPPAQGFRPGDRVRVRSRQEIAKTLKKDGKHKGLWFDKEMESFCGHTARVKTNVERIVDERNGRIIELKSEAYILDGIVCESSRSDGRWFCPRAIYPYWRESWLEPVETNGEDIGAHVEDSRATATP
jgi:hypothetical protein